MIDKAEIIKIKQDLENNIGCKVRLTAKKGRKKSITRHGVIESTYPSIFIIKLEDKLDICHSSRRVSFSYTDILTKSVELSVFEEGDVQFC